MKTKHTPGHWVANIQSMTVCPLANASDIICEVRGVREEDDANARLIAAAPELLEALRAALPWLKRAIKTGPHAKHWANGHDNLAEIELLQGAKRAIAKAEGRS